MIDKHSRLKKEYEELETEALSLKRNLEAAARAEDFEEIIRLKGRAKDLPGEMLAKRIQLYQQEIESLKDELVNARRRRVEAKEHSKNLDITVAAQLQVLSEKRVELNNSALAALANVKVIDAEITATEKKIQAVEAQLRDLLAEAI